MKILHVVPSFYPAHFYGGTIYALYHLCCGLVKAGCEVRVLTTDANGRDKVLSVVKHREVEIVEGLPVRYCHRWLCHAVSPTLLRLLPSYVRWADLVHLTAVYSFPVIPALLTCRMLGKPIVWSPHGALQRWSGSTRLVTKAAWERICWHVAPKRLFLHATSEEEAEASSQRLPGIPTAVIPNGVEIPEKVGHGDGNGSLRLVYLGRLHPKKGIENLLAALKILNGRLDDRCSLVIAGGGDAGYQGVINARIGELGLTDQTKMVGEVVGEGKRRLFENADLVMVPSYTENFGMVVAEALAHGVPVVASKGTPWEKLEQVGCGLWVDNTPESLALAIEKMGRADLRAAGERGRAWVSREFSWDRRAKEMVEVYRSAIASS